MSSLMAFGVIAALSVGGMVYARHLRGMRGPALLAHPTTLTVLACLFGMLGVLGLELVSLQSSADDTDASLPAVDLAAPGGS